MSFSTDGIADRLQSLRLLFPAPRTAANVPTARTLPRRPRRLFIVSRRRLEVESKQTAFAVLFGARFDGVVDAIDVATDNDAVQSLLVFALMAAQHALIHRLIQYHPVPVARSPFHRRLHIDALFDGVIL